MDELNILRQWAMVLATLDALDAGVSAEALREAARVAMQEAE